MKLSDKEKNVVALTIVFRCPFHTTVPLLPARGGGARRRAGCRRACSRSTPEQYTDKIFFIYKEIQNGEVARSYMRRGFLIYKEMRKYLVIYEEAFSQI